MADRLTLSCWIRGFHPLAMVGHWEKFLQAFPFSKLHKGLTTCRVLAVGASEPPIFENAYPAPFDPQTAVLVAREYQHEDCAYQVDCAWDLMQFNRDWNLSPSPVSLWCFGPQFENESGEHMRIEFGLEDPFLPARNEAISVRVAQANLRSLTKLVQDIEKRLPIEKRVLWSESGQNFAERVSRLLAGDAQSALQ